MWSAGRRRLGVAATGQERGAKCARVHHLQRAEPREFGRDVLDGSPREVVLARIACRLSNGAIVATVAVLIGPRVGVSGWMRFLTPPTLKGVREPR